MTTKTLLTTTLIALGLAAAMSPAQAGPAELQTLQNYVGVWSGKGTIKGAENGAAVCKLTFAPNGEKLTYTGRCSMAGNSTSFKGAMLYDDASKRYVMSTSAGGESQTVAGKRSGGSIVFVTGGRDKRGAYSSTMTLGNSIQMNFDFHDAKTNEKTVAQVAFTR